MKSLILPAALLALCLVAATNPAPESMTPTRSASVTVIDDGLGSIMGAVVQLDNGIERSVLVTDEHGQTSWETIDLSIPFELVLADTSHGRGLALGLVETVTPGPLIPGDVEVQTWWITRSMPVALPTLISGSKTEMKNILPSDGAHPHWRIGVPQSSELRFLPSIAPLLDGEAISEYMAYRGQAIDPALYVRGMTFVTPQVSLGEEGFYVGIDLLGDPQGASSVVVDAYNLYEGQGSQGVVNYRVDTLFVERDIVYCHVYGDVERGHLGLFVRDGESGPAAFYSLPDNPRHLSVPEDGGENSMLPPIHEGEVERVAAARPEPLEPECRCSWVTDCEPDTPDPGDWTCDPIAPDAGDCTVTALGASQCQTRRERSPRFCRVAGSVLTAQTYTESKFKVKFEIKGGGPGGAPLQSGSSFEYGRKISGGMTDTWTAAPGAHGLGQCMRWYRFYLDCIQRFKIDVDAQIQDPETGLLTVLPCGTSMTKIVKCQDLSVSQNTCDRTP